MSDTYSPPEVSNIVGLVDTFIRWKESNDNDRAFAIYHPSAFGKCLRLMQYQRYEAAGLIKGDPEEHSSRQLRLFQNGHIMHERWKNYFEELGVLKGVWVCQNPMCRLFSDDGSVQGAEDGEITDVITCIRKFDDKPEWKPRVYGKEELQGVFKPKKCACGCSDFRYDEVLVEDTELNFRGHCDIILDFSRFDPNMFSEQQKKGLTTMFDPSKLPTGTVVVDMKSVGVNAYKNQVLKIGPHKDYQVQLTIYVNVLKCDFGLLWYEEKDQFEVSVFRVDKNPNWWQQIRKQAITMQQMAASPKPLLPPPRPISKSSFYCDKCQFRKFCHKAGGIWDDPQLDEKRRGFYGDLL